MAIKPLRAAGLGQPENLAVDGKQTGILCRVNQRMCCLSCCVNMPCQAAWRHARDDKQLSGIFPDSARFKQGFKT
ncbi:hypothetical protein QPK14_15400 [Photorhabdus temperata subsp. temperata]